MKYCGIDIGSVSSFVFACNEQGGKVLAREVPTSKDGFGKVLKPLLKGGLKVAIEAGNQSAWIYDALVELGADVTVVNPNKVKAIACSRRKTDKIDAKLLCELLRIKGLPEPVHMPGKESRELRGLLVARRQLINARTKLCNVARGMLRQEGVLLPARKLVTFKGWEELQALNYKHGHIPVLLQNYSDSFRSLTGSIHALDKELKARGARDARVELLKTMPLVGLIASLTLLAAVDDVERFDSGRKLIGYAGLAPSVRQSGDRTQHGPITREGRKELRAVWIQIAHMVAISDKGSAKPLRRWFERVAQRRGKRTAIVGLARKLLTVAFQMLKTGEVYEARRVGRAA